MCDIIEPFDACRFRLQGSQDDIVSWGHEYLRNLAGEIGEEYQSRREAEGSVDDLLALVKQIAPHHMAHNAEPEAVDLLLEASTCWPYPPPPPPFPPPAPRWAALDSSAHMPINICSAELILAARITL